MSDVKTVSTGRPSYFVEDVEALEITPIGEGWILVKGTLDSTMASIAAYNRGYNLRGLQADPGWWRKVPGGWNGWNLYEAEPEARGAFQGVRFWTSDYNRPAQP